MADSTYWNDIVPMFFTIAIMVMVFYCLIFTMRTFKKFRMRHRTYFNLISNVGRSNFLLPVFPISFSGIRQSFWAMAITVIYGFICICFSVCSTIYFLILFVAFFAPFLMAVCVFYALMKLKKCFKLIAVRTLFCYDWFRHFCFLFKQTCLGPVPDYISVAGSFHYTTIGMVVND